MGLDLEQPWGTATTTPNIHFALSQFWECVDNDRRSLLSAVDLVISSTPKAPDEYRLNIQQVLEILVETQSSLSEQGSEYEQALSGKITALETALMVQSSPQSIAPNSVIIHTPAANLH